MSEKFPEIDRTYFNEMTELLDKKKRIKFVFSAQNKAGIALCVSGGISLSAGLAVIIYDLAGYYQMVRSNYDNYSSGVPRSQGMYDIYKNSFYTSISMFVVGMILSSTGLIMIITGLPLIIYKKKEKKMSITLGLFPGPGINCIINL
jgi:hypothetical protein